MKKLAIFVLALAALSFGCNVGDARWCTEYIDDSFNNTATHFGGPENTIRKMLHDPCERTRVEDFYMLESELGETLFFVFTCPETRVWIEIRNDDTLFVHKLHSNRVIGTITGEKAIRAFRLADSVAKEITSRANKYNWNP